MAQHSDLHLSSSGYFDLGIYSRKITTQSEKSQTWFTRGLIWSYAFNHEESVRCFERAIASDPDCPMAHWGLAYALGPNYNKPWAAFDEDELKATLERTFRAVNVAESNSKLSAPVEQALITALRARYSHAQVDDPKQLDIWSKEYAESMRKAYGQFPDDLDVAALYADALMNLTPWNLWDLRTGQPASGARTLEVKAVLDRALAQDDSHPGVLHLYIHLMEMSSAPEKALTLADRLRDLVPDAGHLQHMPSHLDILCGDYRRAISSNTDAVLADEKFLARAGRLDFYSLYQAHNFHFLIYAAMFAGQSKVCGQQHHYFSFPQ